MFTTGVSPALFVKRITCRKGSETPATSCSGAYPTDRRFLSILTSDGATDAKAGAYSCQPGERNPIPPKALHQHQPEPAAAPEAAAAAAVAAAERDYPQPTTTIPGAARPEDEEKEEGR